MNQHMKNKHNEFYQQFVDSLGLSGGMIENSREDYSGSYDSYSDDSSSPKSRARGMIKKEVGSSDVGKKQHQKSLNDIKNNK